MDQPATEHPGTAGPGHWDTVYRERGAREVSWFQTEPQPSLDLITSLAPSGQSAVIDVGGGTSPLAAHLIEAGFTDVTVLDVSQQALEIAKRASGGDVVTWIRADLLSWRPRRRYQIWHDRAVFHFLTDPADRSSYLATLRQALSPGGMVVMGTFAPDGPTHCSGLPVARYAAAGLAAELGDGFTLAATRTDRHHTPGGAEQPFTWIVARAQ